MALTLFRRYHEVVRNLGSPRAFVIYAIYIGLTGMQFITDYADQALILPLVLIAAVGLGLGGWLRAAAAWLIVVSATFGFVGATKILLFVACPCSMFPTLMSPSGHTAAATLIYGGGAGLLLRRDANRVWFAMACALPIAALFAVTRIALHLHSVPDVLAGASMGLAGALMLVIAAGPKPANFRPIFLVASMVAPIVGLHGLHLSMEPWLQAIGKVLWNTVSDRPE